MRETGLFDMFAYHIIGNVKDCVSGIEVGMDTNARKNRGGHATEWLVSGAIEASGFKSGHITRKTSGVFGSVVYLSNMKLEFPRLALDPIAGEDNADKRFDFVVKAGNCLYDREANFHSGDGSKLNETARSYKETALASRDRVCFEFA